MVPDSKFTIPKSEVDESTYETKLCFSKDSIGLHIYMRVYVRLLVKSVEYIKLYIRLSENYLNNSSRTQKNDMRKIKVSN